MKSVKIAELKDKLSEHLRAVEAGEVVIVTDRDRPIARIVPIQPAESPLRFNEPATAFQALRGKKWPAARWTLSSAQLLEAERKET
ncbi:MAG: Antitoxin Phd YefM, type toxin-antitoxin system [Pseudomonadota bacterium]|jgi:prevent-host-death family protein